MCENMASDIGIFFQSIFIVLNKNWNQSSTDGFGLRQRASKVDERNTVSLMKKHNECHHAAKMCQIQFVFP